MEKVKQELENLTLDKIDLYQEEGLLFENTPKEYLKYLNNVLDNFNFVEDFSYLLYIYPIVSHCLCSSEIKKIKKKELLEILKEIREKIQILILRKPGEITKDNPNFALLKKLIDNTESLMIAGFYDVLDYYKGNNLELISYLLFEVREYNLVEDIFNLYPYMIRLKDDNNISLFEKVISNYLDELTKYTSDKNLSTNFDLIYYDKVIDLFLENEKLELSFKQKMDILSHINYCRKNIKNDEHNNLTKRKYLFWLNHLEEKLIDENHIMTFKELCYMYDIKSNFDEGILSETRRLNKEIKPSMYQNREIINNEYIITIDGEDANELDDALSIEKLENSLYKLGIHIADPTGLIPEDNIIMDGAYERNSSIYFPGNTIFMFPEVLAKDKMNLLENKNRLATSIYLYIDNYGKIENYEFKETIINVNLNTTYENINNVVNDSQFYDIRLIKTVRLLNEVVSKLKNNYKIDETYALVNRTEKNPTETNITHNTNSSKIVETCMMMANYIIARHMNKNNLLCINRVHMIDQEYIKKLSSIEENLHSNDDKEVERAIRHLKAIYPKSRYSVTENGHFGLGLDNYCHFTSPLRRYSDVAMKQYVLNPFYFNLVNDKEAYLIEEKLKDICKHMNERNSITNSFLESCSKEKSKIYTKKI